MLNKTIILLLFTKTFSALASNDVTEVYSPSDKVWWQGTAKFLGKVISPVCTLDMDSQYQSIDLCVIPINKVTNNKLLVNKKIKIKLSDCQFISKARNIDKVKGVTMTFYSDVSGTGTDFFSFNNNKDIYFKITNELGNTVKVGYPLPIIQLNGDNAYLYYELDVMQKNEMTEPGSYYASVMFKMNYE